MITPGRKTAALATAGLLLAATGLEKVVSHFRSDYQKVANVSSYSDNPIYINIIEKPFNYQETYHANPEVVAEKTKYQSFKYKQELGEITRHATRMGIEPELLMAIRSAENGGKGREYGVVPSTDFLRKRYAADKGYIENGKFVQYENDTEKQVAWCARSVKNILENRANVGSSKDPISFLAEVYSPIGADNDPKGLNKHWEENVRHFYEKFKAEK